MEHVVYHPFTMMWQTTQQTYVSQLYFILTLFKYNFHKSEVGIRWWLVRSLADSQQLVHPDQIVLMYIVQQQTVNKDEMVIAIRIPCLIVGESWPIQSI